MTTMENRGGKREGSGKPRKYSNPKSCTFWVEREILGKLEEEAEKNGIKKNEMLNKLLEIHYGIRRKIGK